MNRGDVLGLVGIYIGLLVGAPPLAEQLWGVNPEQTFWLILLTTPTLFFLYFLAKLLIRLPREFYILIGILLLIGLIATPITLIFIEGAPLRGAILVFIGFLSLLIGIFRFWYYRSYPWTVIKSNYTLQILDPDGKHARLNKTLYLRSNRINNRLYHHSPFSHDGTLDRISTTDDLVEHTVVAGDELVTVKFSEPLRLFEIIQTSIDWEFLYAFIGDEETFGLDIDRPVLEISVRIIFPIDRLPSTINLIKSGTTYESIPLTLEGNEVYWNIKSWLRPLQGRYILTWQW